MKIALVHDYLNQLGGGERVLDELLVLFPDADVYTLLHDQKKTQGRYTGRVKKTSFLDLPFVRAHHRIFIPLMPLAALSINLGRQYDLIISDTAGFAKGIRYDRKSTKHISYIHTPLRYAWETYQYFGSSFLARLFAFVCGPAFWYVRRFDYWSAQRPNALLANSQYIAWKIKTYYGRSADLVYPPVADFWYDLPAERSVASSRYYVAGGRLLHYKKIDLIIDACGKMGAPLVIFGEGQELETLRKRAQPYKNITFVGRVTEDELRALYRGAEAFIMANEEDFGLVMAEAQACGTPVIAYGKGGAREIVQGAELGIRNKELATGVFFEEQTVESLMGALKKASMIDFDRSAIQERAKGLARDQFVRRLRGHLQNNS